MKIKQLIIIFFSVIYFISCNSENKTKTENKIKSGTTEASKTPLPTLEPIPTNSPYPIISSIPLPSNTSIPLPTSTSIPIPSDQLKVECKTIDENIIFKDEIDLSDKVDLINNKINCKDYSDFILENKIDYAKVKNNLEFAIAKKVNEWNQVINLEKEDILLDFKKAKSIKFEKNGNCIENSKSKKIIDEVNSRTCYLPSSIDILSTGVSIHIHNQSKYYGDHNDVNDKKEYWALIGGIAWRSEPLHENSISLDTSAFYWYVDSLLNQYYQPILGLYDPFTQIKIINLFNSLPKNNCQTKAIQISSDDFIKNNSYWFAQKTNLNEDNSKSKCEYIRGILSPLKDDSNLENPWEIYERYKSAEILSGSYLSGYDELTNQKIDCDIVFNCKSMYSNSVRKVFSISLSPSKSAGSIWVRFLWKPIEWTKYIITTVEISTSTGDFNSIISRVLSSGDSIPEFK